MHISCSLPWLSVLLGTCRILQMLMLGFHVRTRCFAKNTSERTPEQSVRGHRATCRILNPLAPDISRTIQLNCHCAIFPLTTPDSSVDIGKVLTDSPKNRCNSINSHEKRWPKPITITRPNCHSFASNLESCSQVPRHQSLSEEKLPPLIVRRKSSWYLQKLLQKAHDVYISQKEMMIFCGSLWNCQLSMSGGLKQGSTPRRS